MEPTGAAFDAGSGFVELFDRDHGPDPVDNILEALCGAPAHGGDRGCGDWHGEPVAHQVGQSHLGADLDMQQIAHPCRDAWPVLDRGGTSSGRSRRSCAASATEGTVGAVFGGLQ